MRQGQKDAAISGRGLLTTAVAFCISWSPSLAFDAASAAAEASCSDLGLIDASGVPASLHLQQRGQVKAVSLLAIRVNTTVSIASNTSEHSGRVDSTVSAASNTSELSSHVNTDENESWSARHSGWFNRGNPFSFGSKADKKKMNGQNAPLSSDGYDFVASMEDDVQMEHFIVRVIKAMHLTIIDEGGLHGVVPYHSGLTASQTFENLKMDIKRGLHKHGKYNAWLEKEKDPSRLEVLKKKMKEGKEKLSKESKQKLEEDTFEEKLKQSQKKKKHTN